MSLIWDNSVRRVAYKDLQAEVLRISWLGALPLPNGSYELEGWLYTPEWVTGMMLLTKVGEV